MNKRANQEHEIGWFEIIATIITMAIVSAILLGSFDGMLTDTTTRPTRPTIEESK